LIAAYFLALAQGLAATPDFAANPVDPECARAISQGATCEAANKRATELMNARGLEAATAVFEVQTGALIAYAATPGPDAARKDAEPLKVTTPILPLSLTKLFLAASWWDHALPDRSFDCTRSATPDKKEPMTIPDMIVIGCDLPAQQMAIALRKEIGTKGVLAYLERFGFNPKTKSRDDSFWTEVAPEWREALAPAAAYTLLNDKTSDSNWADTLSLGETNFVVTIPHVSRFLQAVGNNGVLLPPVARKETDKPASKAAPQSRRIMKENTAMRLQTAMRDVVQRGSAQAIAHTLDGTGWQIGGKTGTGPGLIGPQGKARFTVATFVRHGGRGGENAAMICAELARYLIEKGK
jgi:cell division protein FtsI/penicillin-binding protein 2